MAARGRSCQTCDLAAMEFDGDDPVVACHLSPPMTLPTLEVDEIDGVDVSIDMSDAHRYPHVRLTDWCAGWVADPDKVSP